MARKPRFNLPRCPQHVVQRGNNRSPAFFRAEDYDYYISCLHDACLDRRCAVHAYVLMPNHVHLLMTPEEEYSVSRVMQDVGRRYVRYVNQKYRRTGTLWEGRYKASLVQSEGYVLICSRYIEQNPVRASIVHHPKSYPWSSYSANAKGCGSTVVTPHTEYLGLGRTSLERQATYREISAKKLGVSVLHEIRTTLNQELVLGSVGYQGEIEASLNRQASPRRRGRPRQEA